MFASVPAPGKEQGVGAELVPAGLQLVTSPLLGTLQVSRSRVVSHAFLLSSKYTPALLLHNMLDITNISSVGRPCGTWMHYAFMRDVKDMGQQMGYRSLEWNWPKEAMNRPIWAGIFDGTKLF